MEYVICEDNSILLNLYSIIIQNEIDTLKNNDSILLSTNNPHEVLNVIKAEPEQPRVYLLDIEFSNSVMKGIQIAERIRRVDRVSKIIFISNHSELIRFTVTSQVEAFDYIDKSLGLEMLEKRLKADVKAVSEFSGASPEIFQYRVGDKENQVEVKKIDFIETIKNSKKVQLHTSGSIISFNSNLKEIVLQLPMLYRLNRSCLVNLDNVEKVDLIESKLLFDNGNYLKISYAKGVQIKFLLSRK